MSTIRYNAVNEAEVRKTFETLYTRLGSKPQALAQMNNNTIATTNADTWISELQKDLVLVDEWGLGKVLYRGKQCTHNGILYNIIQTHEITNPAFTPDAVPSLYRLAPFTYPGRVYPRWNSIGLLDAENNWKLNDRVDWNNNYWISTQANNIWEPGVFGWNQL